MKKPVLFSSFFLAILLYSTPSYSGDETTDHLTWLRDFFSKGIQSAHAQYTVSAGTIQHASGRFFQRKSYTADFIFAEKKYDYTFIYEYQDEWTELTNNNTTAPPKQEIHFVGSRIIPWTEKDGYGFYREEFERSLPNWFVFDDLDSVIIRQCDIRNPLPPITGILYADEFKALKRVRKECLANGSSSGIWSCFEYDEAGNATEISRAYLGTLDARNLVKTGGFEDYTITIRNNNDEPLFVDILTGSSPPQFMEGICLRRDENQVKIYNLEINSLFHKFVPELVKDPRELIASYLRALQAESDKDLLRFETVGN